MRFTHKFIFITIISFISFATSCSNPKEEETINLAESLMESHPDSALAILDSISIDGLNGKRLKARYALLKSMALDKNYIDTTTFDVLQPALDYYLENGTTDEKLRTYYYQGCIYQNAGRDDLAMQSWLNTQELDGEIADSLTLARLLVARGTLFYKQYKISDFVESNLQAGKIFGGLGNPRMQIYSYAYALDGTVILEDKTRSDSIALLCKGLAEKYPEHKHFIDEAMLNYIIEYGDDEDIAELLAKYDKTDISDELMLKMVKGYLKLGEAETAGNYLNHIYIPADDLRD